MRILCNRIAKIAKQKNMIKTEHKQKVPKLRFHEFDGEWEGEHRVSRLLQGYGGQAGVSVQVSGYNTIAEFAYKSVIVY